MSATKNINAEKIQGNLSINSVSATTYYNLPTSGGSFTGGTVTGETIFTNGVTANTISATTYYNLPSTTFTGGTVAGETIFTNGLTANTISADTYIGDGSNLTNISTPYGTVYAISIGNFLP
jgi:hypothetical protein